MQKGVAALNNVAVVRPVTATQRFTGWLVHFFTASGACVGLLSLNAIYQHNLITALWLMAAAILIDAVDGMFARQVRIKEAVPEIDGALLDNVVDFANYTLIPCFFLLVTDILPDGLKMICVMSIMFASAYQFTQVDAKTEDHFFKGFPSYWNIAVFYLFFWQMSSFTNLVILFTLAVLSFIPVKYVYPARLDFLTSNPLLRMAMGCITLIWGAATAGMLWLYPESNIILVSISMGYCLLYMGISLYRTYNPLVHSKE